jgi:hypothetical protein
MMFLRAVWFFDLWRFSFAEGPFGKKRRKTTKSPRGNAEGSLRPGFSAGPPGGKGLPEHRARSLVGL